MALLKFSRERSVREIYLQFSDSLVNIVKLNMKPSPDYNVLLLFKFSSV